MDELTKKHKQEVKELNLRGAELLKGKKGPERKAAEDQVFILKKNLALNHELEIRELEQKLLDEPASEPSKAGSSQAEDVEVDDQPVAAGKKPTRAQQRFLAKQEKERLAKEALGQAQSTKPSARDLEASALAEQMSQLGLKIVEIPPNGDCLFGAVAHQRMFYDADQMTVAELRDLAASTMQKSPALFVPFLPEGETLDSYCAKIKTPAEWGGQLELRALALALRRPIFVYSARSPVVQMCRNDFPTATAYRLTFHEQLFSLGEHYNSAIPVDDE